MEQKQSRSKEGNTEDDERKGDRELMEAEKVEAGKALANHVTRKGDRLRGRDKRAERASPQIDTDQEFRSLNLGPV